MIPDGIPPPSSPPLPAPIPAPIYSAVKEQLQNVNEELLSDVSLTKLGAAQRLPQSREFKSARVE